VVSPNSLFSVEKSLGKKPVQNFHQDVISLIFLSKPADFHSAFEVASCIVEHNGKILLLLRQDHKPEGNTWCLPAGKVEPHETIQAAVIREIREETGIELVNPFFFKSVFVRYPKYDYVYHIFHVTLNQAPVVTCNPAEHKQFQWKTPADALKENLILDLDACLKLFYKQ